MNGLGKDLLGLAGMTREQITTILDVAEPGRGVRVVGLGTRPEGRAVF